MIKKISLLLGLVAALPASSFAWVGGPFDGGDFNQLLDDRGIYQAAFRFENGSGFSQFGVNVDLGPSASSSAVGGGAQNQTSTSIGSYLNRTIAYYAGVTYFGNAMGIVDHSSRRVHGFGNGSSEVSLTASSSTTSNNFFGSSASASATSTITSNNGIQDTFNVNWEAKITSTHPELRFEGSGELTVIRGTPYQYAVLGYDREYDEDGNLQSETPNIEIVYAPENLTYETMPITVYGARKYFLSMR